MLVGIPEDRFLLPGANKMPEAPNSWSFACEVRSETAQESPRERAPSLEGRRCCIKASAGRELDKSSQWPKKLCLQLPTFPFQWQLQTPSERLGHITVRTTHRAHRHTTDVRAECTCAHTELKANSRESGSDRPPCCPVQRWRQENQWYKLNTLGTFDVLFQKLIQLFRHRHSMCLTL